MVATVYVNAEQTHYKNCQETSISPGHSLPSTHTRVSLRRATQTKETSITSTLSERAMRPEKGQKKDVAHIGGTVNRTRAGADLDRNTRCSPATTRRHTTRLRILLDAAG